MEPYHPLGYKIHRPDPTEENPIPEYTLKFEAGVNPVPEELINGKEAKIQVDDKFQIFGHYKHPFLYFDNSELDIHELIKHIPCDITIWY